MLEYFHNKTKSVRVFIVLMILITLSFFTIYFFLYAYLKQTSAQLTNDFYRQNAVVMERGDSYELVYRLNALSSSLHWVCIRAMKNNTLIFEKNRSSDCGSGFFQRVEVVRAKGNSDLNVQLTVGLSSNLKWILLLYVLFQLIFLCLIGWIKIKQEQEKLKLSLEWQQQIKSIIEQVVHDIRSPLSALKLAIQKGNITHLLISATQRIESILNDLQNKEADASGNTKNKELLVNSTDNLVSAINEIVEEKKFFVESTSPDLKICFVESDKELKLQTTMQDQVFTRLLSNILNNAIESFDQFTPENQKINIFLKKKIRNLKEYAVIEVIDNGKGIHPDHLKMLKERGGSFDKKDGKGLGLKYAKDQLQALKGFMEIDSTQNRQTENRTRIALYLPLLVDAVIRKKKEKFKIALIDDDSFTHKYWEIASTLVDVELASYKNYKDFLLYNHDKNIPIFLDKNFGEDALGYDLAEKLFNDHKYTSIYLVTGDEVSSESLPVYFKNYIPHKQFPNKLIASLKQSAYLN